MNRAPCRADFDSERIRFGNSFELLPISTFDSKVFFFQISANKKCKVDTILIWAIFDGS